jgi:Tfp pilus assembly protein FimT
MKTWRVRCLQGLTLPELLVATTVAMLVATALLPSLEQFRGAVRTAAAARLLVVRLQGLRAKSVSRACAFGLLFQRDEHGWLWFEVRDGNGNGLRTADLSKGRDMVLSGPHRFADLLPNVDFGFPERKLIPRIPPRAGWVHDLERPVRIGNTALLSFSPLGTSSSGTLFVSDGQKHLMAIVLYGRTGRIRVWRHDFENSRWTL